MLQGTRLRAVLLGWLTCLSAPVALFALTMPCGASEWRDEGEPVPWPTHWIDGLFLADVLWTVLLIWLMRGARWLTACLVVPLLCLTALLAFWGGLWVSGQWL